MKVSTKLRLFEICISNNKREETVEQTTSIHLKQHYMHVKISMWSKRNGKIKCSQSIIL